MPLNSLSSLQYWFSSELDFLGIDSTIYSRHVLNLFLNSDYIMDYRLAEKEANIFANLSGNHLKHQKKKYRKRSNSFTHSDENIWKKQMAVNFLMTAIDDDDDASTTRDSIESLINKLDGQIHRISGNNSANENRSIRSEKRKQRTNERYQDAFPLLGSGDIVLDYEHAKQAHANIWTNSKSAQEVKEVEEMNKINRNRRGHLRKKQIDTTDSDRTAKNPKHFKSYDMPKSNDADAKPEPKGSSSRKAATLRRKQRGGNGMRCKGTRKRPSSLVKTHSPNKSKDSSKKLPIKRSSCWPKGDLLMGAPSTSVCGLHDGNDNDLEMFCHQADQNNNNSSSGQCVFYPVDHHHHHHHHLHNEEANCSSPVHFQFPGSRHCRATSVEENCISHLYSVDASCLDLSYHSGASHQPPPQSKWFRNPESGFLEFEPAYKRSSSQTSSENDIEDGGLPAGYMAGDQSDSEENWLWCPSPSLWENTLADGEPSCQGNGAVSRLETLYRSSAASSPTIEDELTARLWESYKAIFTGVTNPTTNYPNHDYLDEVSSNLDGYSELDLLDDLQFLNDELNNLPVSLMEELNADSSDMNGNFFYDQLMLPMSHKVSEPVTPRAKLLTSASFDYPQYSEQAAYSLFKSHSDSNLDLSQHFTEQKSPPSQLQPKPNNLPYFRVSPASFCVDSDLEENDIEAEEANKEIEDLNLPEAVPTFHYQYEDAPPPSEPPVPAKEESQKAFASGDNNQLVELSTDAFLSSLYDGDLMDLDAIMNLSKMFQPTSAQQSTAAQQSTFNGRHEMSRSKQCCTKIPCMEHYHGLDDFITGISDSIFANMCWMFDWDHISPCVDQRDSFAQYWRPPNSKKMREQPSVYSKLRKGSGVWDIPDLMPESKEDPEDDLYYMSMLALSVVESVVDMADRNNGSNDASPVPSCLLPLPISPGKRKFHSPPRVGGKLKDVKGRLDEVMITDNDAWKTSLRIGNMWQAIAGIRPVDVIYSEKRHKSADDSVAQLQPTTATHFRPIRPSESSADPPSDDQCYQQYDDPSTENPDCFDDGATAEVVNSVQDLTANYGLHHFIDTFASDAAMCDVPLQGLQHELGNLLGGETMAYTKQQQHSESLFTTCDNNNYNTSSSNSMFNHGYKDKCLQTTFEQQIRMIDRDICHQFAIRPPKANSR